jgi:dynein intermediate chain 2
LPLFATIVRSDPDTAKGKRTVACISWAPPTGDKPSTKLAVAYADFNFQAQPDGQSANSYIWDINNPNDPEQTLESISPLCSIQFNTKDSNLVLGGMYNGLLGA